MSRRRGIYSELIERLFAVNLHGGVKLGLDNAQRLDAALGYPSTQQATIHIAGTNGKGSVAVKVAKALENSGYRVGLFTSPHICSFRERIQVDGQLITVEEVEDLLPEVFEAAEQTQVPATFFELTTLLAMRHFAQKNVDVAVLEVGLGGRLDATNIVVPVVSVITSISLDHCGVLGDTAEAIAKEKAGIIKEGVPVVVGPRVPKVVHDIAKERRAPLLQVGGVGEGVDDENRGVARAVLELLQGRYTLGDDAIAGGLAALPPCRQEVVAREGVSVVLDVAHNPEAFQRLFAATLPPPVRVVVGLSRDKDLQGCLRAMIGRVSHYHLVEGGNGRGAPLDEMEATLRQLGVSDDKVSLGPSVTEAMERALKEAQDRGEGIVACGSVFIMSEVRKALGLDDPCDTVELNERY